MISVNKNKKFNKLKINNWSKIKFKKLYNFIKQNVKFKIKIRIN